MLSGFRFTLAELSGSLADIGSMVPFILGAVLMGSFELAPVLLMFAAAHIAAGFWYRIPMSVQPMKAIGALVIAGGLTHGQAVGAGLVTGMFFLMLGLSGMISHIAGSLPRSIIRGTQLGMASIIAARAFDLILHHPVSGVLSILLIAIFFIFGMKGISAISLLGLGFLYGIMVHGLPAFNPASGLSLYLPGPDEILYGTLNGAVSQIPLTFVNAILGTSLIVSDLYSRDIRPERLAVSTGLMNLVSAPFGGIPMCHGSSGIAAHYRFGARTGGSNMIIGTLLIVPAIFISADFLLILPAGIAGTLLLAAGYELGRNFRDTESIVLTILVAAVSLITNIATGFLIGTTLFLINRMCRRRKEK